MRSVDILRVSIDDAGRLTVQPDLALSDDFEFIWRTASGIRWDSVGRELFAPASTDLSALGWFQGIVSAVQGEYGTSLVLTGDTQWVNVPIDVKQQIETWVSVKATWQLHQARE